MWRLTSRACVGSVLAACTVATAGCSGARPAGNSPAGVLDLGTLGGANSAATAVAGSIVVGWSQTARGTRHAFVFDRRRAGGLRDLGTLGGRNSAAVAVSGPVVVGWSQTSAGTRHAFAYDLTAATAAMVDLGTLAAHDAGNSAAAVDGPTVVGWSDTSAAGRGHDAFVVDLSRSRVGLIDLGPGEATDVSGSLVSIAIRKRPVASTPPPPARSPATNGAELRRNRTSTASPRGRAGGRLRQGARTPPPRVQPCERS